MDSQFSEKINSSRYWDQRFAADWKENMGIEQSQFFSRIAVDNLPDWFLRYIQQHQPSFCDWGCAMGNGTAILHDLLSLKNITGIDFSRVAIEQAASTFPNIPFIAIDILKDEEFPQFDVIFSSNTLEHFTNPWEILEKLSRFANKFIVILIPFQEYNRHYEHFYTFDTANIPSTVRDSHYLIHFSILNAADYPASHWNGRQILLLYANYPQLSELGLTLSNLLESEQFRLPTPLMAITDSVDRMSAALIAKTCEIQDEQKRLQDQLSQLKEQLLLASDLLNKRLDGTYNLIAATNASEKEALSLAVQSIQNEVLAEKKDAGEKLQLLNSNLDTAVQYLRNEISLEKKETTEKLLLLNGSLDAIRESLSRRFRTRIRNLFS